MSDADKDGAIYSIDVATMNSKRQMVVNFPKNISFNPHGMDVYDNQLYVINHASAHKGGERIEVFDIRTD